MLSRSARKVAAALADRGLDAEVRELPDSTRTARDAAQALGCEVGQIIKSLVFRDVERDQPVLVLASGSDRVDEDELAAVHGSKVNQATGAFVRERTGFAIGGVPPLGHAEPIVTYMDSGVLDHVTVWAAAGTPRAVFCTSPQELRHVAGAKLVSVASARASG